jgi:hypothetical protein
MRAVAFANASVLAGTSAPSFSIHSRKSASRRSRQRARAPQVRRPILRQRHLDVRAIGSVRTLEHVKLDPQTLRRVLHGRYLDEPRDIEAIFELRLAFFALLDDEPATVARRVERVGGALRDELGGNLPLRLRRLIRALLLLLRLLRPRVQTLVLLRELARQRFEHRAPLLQLGDVALQQRAAQLVQRKREKRASRPERAKRGDAFFRRVVPVARRALARGQPPGEHHARVHLATDLELAHQQAANERVVRLEARGERRGGDVVVARRDGFRRRLRRRGDDRRRRASTATSRSARRGTPPRTGTGPVSGVNPVVSDPASPYSSRHTPRDTRNASARSPFTHSEEPPAFRTPFPPFPPLLFRFSSAFFDVDVSDVDVSGGFPPASETETSPNTGDRAESASGTATVKPSARAASVAVAARSDQRSRQKSQTARRSSPDKRRRRATRSSNPRTGAFGLTTVPSTSFVVRKTSIVDRSEGDA